MKQSLKKASKASAAMANREKHGAENGVISASLSVMAKASASISVSVIIGVSA
jgi:hypothetical protein